MENAKSMISTQNGSLVMQMGPIEENTFHLITGTELFKHIEEKRLPNISGIYPFLSKGIETLSKYESERKIIGIE